MSFNLLVSCPRGKESMARSELTYFLLDLGDNASRIYKTRFSGLLEASTSLDPFTVVDRARQEALENPWNFRYITKMVPIEKVVSTNLNDITRAARELENELSQCDSFRVTVVRRGSILEGEKIISEVASLFSQSVNLESPSCVLLIEVVGELTGVTVLRKPVFSLQRTVNGMERLTKV
ncbi:THUMP domain-containing protein [Tardisphaera miroshnichenkoae]